MVRRSIRIAAVLALGASVGWALLASGIHLRRVTSGSMAPTYAVGSWVVTRERPSAAADVGRDDVVVLRYPFGSDLRAIKRVVALPGDRVRLSTNEVVVSGRSIAVEPADGGADSRVSNAGRDDEVAAGHVFVLGDNSGASIDSRSFGDVPESELAGRVLFGLPEPPVVEAVSLAAMLTAGVALVRWLRSH